MHHKCGYTHAMDGTNKVRVLAPRLISRDTEDTMQLGPREYKLTGYHRVQHQAHQPLNTMIRWTGGEQGSAAFQHLQPAGNYHRHRQGGAGLNPEGYQEAVSLSSTLKGPGMTTLTTVQMSPDHRWWPMMATEETWTTLRTV